MNIMTKTENQDAVSLPAAYGSKIERIQEKVLN